MKYFEFSRQKHNLKIMGFQNNFASKNSNISFQFYFYGQNIDSLPHCVLRIILLPANCVVKLGRRKSQKIERTTRLCLCLLTCELT